MIESSQLEKMSVTERLKAIDQLWDSLNRSGDEIPSPDWHQDVLAERKARAQRGEAKFLTLDQLRSRLCNSGSATRSHLDSEPFAEEKVVAPFDESSESIVKNFNHIPD
jgi:putative addiction module component (TIGR02574 family)